MTHDDYFARIAKRLAKTSPVESPSTKVGAVLVANKKTVISTGVNRPALSIPYHFYDVERNQPRSRYLNTTLHAEMVAIIQARGQVADTLYVYPMMPCAQCAAALIEYGVRRVVVVDRAARSAKNRWLDSFHDAQMQFDRAGVTLSFI
jgi:dCMP deaminase